MTLKYTGQAGNYDISNSSPKQMALMLGLCLSLYAHLGIFHQHPFNQEIKATAGIIFRDTSCRNQLSGLTFHAVVCKNTKRVLTKNSHFPYHDAAVRMNKNRHFYAEIRYSWQYNDKIYPSAPKLL